MNKIIKRELEKVRANIEYDDNTTKIIIPKDTNKVNDVSEQFVFQIGKSYNIVIAGYVINEPEGFTLSSNWNGGRKPKTNSLNICVTKILGKMLQFDGCGFDLKTNTTTTDLYQQFWLPRAAILRAKEI